MSSARNNPCKHVTANHQSCDNGNSRCRQGAKKSKFPHTNLMGFLAVAGCMMLAATMSAMLTQQSSKA